MKKTITSACEVMVECDCCWEIWTTYVDLSSAYRGAYLGRCPHCVGDALVLEEIQEGCLYVWKEETE